MTKPNIATSPGGQGVTGWGGGSWIEGKNRKNGAPSDPLSTGTVSKVVLLVPEGKNGVWDGVGVSGWPRGCTHGPPPIKGGCHHQKKTSLSRQESVASAILTVVFSLFYAFFRGYDQKKGKNGLF